jgi:predicted secreted hydrolase
VVAIVFCTAVAAADLAGGEFPVGDSAAQDSAARENMGAQTPVTQNRDSQSRYSQNRGAQNLAAPNENTENSDGQGPPANGFAGLGQSANGFAMPKPGQAFDFPRDHIEHGAFRIEWWYLTANLIDETGAHLGVQWTLFRNALSRDSGDGWQTPQIWLGHAGVTTKESHHFAQRLARGGVGQAGSQLGPFSVWIDDWAMAARPHNRLQGDPNGSPNDGSMNSLDALLVTARGEDFSYDLQLQAHGPIIAHGDNGFSVKSPTGQASHYYAQPFYQVSGKVLIDGKSHMVTGQGWLDREWSSQPLSDTQQGWDWFSLHFQSGEKLMVFRLRDTDGGFFDSGTWIDADGTTHPFGPGRIEISAGRLANVAGYPVPVEWQLRDPVRGLDVTVAALNDDAWMGTSIAYWEGPITIRGSHSGLGYLEMTGYDGAGSNQPQTSGTRP